MTGVLRKLLDLPSDTPIEIAGKKGRGVGLIEIPEIFVDNTDRNRTSPFAFTGNRFEFRAVGSSANCGEAMATLNAAVAQQLTAFKLDVDKALASGKAMDVAVMDTLKPIIASILDVVCFDGNGYSEEWKKEAARRGLDIETKVPDMIKAYLRPEAISLFAETGVFTEKEIAARCDVKWETYCKKVQIESRVMARMAANHIVPTAIEYKTHLLKELSLTKEVFGRLEGCDTERNLVMEMSALIEEIRTRVDVMHKARKAANAIEDSYERASAYRDIAESLNSLRKPIDRLEEIVDNRLWPLPKYRELLFIS